MREWIKYRRRGIVYFRRMGREVATGYTLAEVQAYPSPMAQMTIAALPIVVSNIAAHNPLLRALLRDGGWDD